MKLSNDQQYVDHNTDIIELIEELKEKYNTIYWTHIYGQIYIYKPLGRKDYKEICEDESLDNLEKEDEVVKKALLYPHDFDLDNVEAGIIAKLVKIIMENSYLTSIETRTAVMDYFRSEMYDFQEQVTCIINEAFPQFDIEEIENWGIERTSKYLSRAEWKLQNLRGMVFDHDVMDQMQQMETAKVAQEAQPEVAEPPKAENKGTSKQKMTPQKLAELKAKFPEIDWDKDVIANEGIDGMREHVDSLSVALRPGGR